MDESFRHGFASSVTMVCDGCGHREDGALAERRPPVKYYDINRRSVLGMRLIGRGREAVTTN